MSNLINVIPEKVERFDVWSALVKLVSASVTLTGLGTLITFVLIFAYLHTIGTPELMVKALAAPSELWPWIIVSSLLLLFYLMLLLLTTLTYALAIHLFKKTPSVQSAMAIYLLIPTLAGVVATVYSTLERHNSSVVGVFIDCAVWVVVGMIVLFLMPKFNVSLGGAISNEDAKAVHRLSYLKHMSGLAMSTWIAAITATFPMLAVMSAPSVLYNAGSMTRIVWISILLTVLGFTPAIAYYVSKGAVITRVRNALIGVVALIIATLVIVPTAVPTAVDQAAVLAGIKDERVFSYMLTETYAVEDFDARWGDVVTKRNYPVVEGLILFTLGGVTLLCPKTLEGSDLSEWASKSGSCLTLSSDMVKRMPLKQ